MEGLRRHGTRRQLYAQQGGRLCSSSIGRTLASQVPPDGPREAPCAQVSALLTRAGLTKSAILASGSNGMHIRPHLAAGLAPLAEARDVLPGKANLGKETAAPLAMVVALHCSGVWSCCRERTSY